MEENEDKLKWKTTIDAAFEEVRDIKPIERHTDEITPETEFRRDFSVSKFKSGAESGNFKSGAIDMAKKTKYPSKVAQEMANKYVNALEDKDTIEAPIQTKVKTGEKIVGYQPYSMQPVTVDTFTQLSDTESKTLSEKNLEDRISQIPPTLRDAMKDGRISFSGLEDFSERLKISRSENNDEILKNLKNEYPNANLVDVSLGDGRIDGLYFTKDKEKAEELEDLYKRGKITKEDYLKNEYRWDKLKPSLLDENSSLKNLFYRAADAAPAIVQTAMEASAQAATGGAGLPLLAGGGILKRGMRAGLAALGFKTAEEGSEYIDKTQAEEFLDVALNATKEGAMAFGFNTTMDSAVHLMNYRKGIKFDESTVKLMDQMAEIKNILPLENLRTWQLIKNNAIFHRLSEQSAYLGSAIPEATRSQRKTLIKAFFNYVDANAPLPAEFNQQFNQYMVNYRRDLVNTVLKNPEKNVGDYAQNYAKSITTLKTDSKMVLSEKYTQALARETPLFDYQSLEDMASSLKDRKVIKIGVHDSITVDGEKVHVLPITMSDGSTMLTQTEQEFKEISVKELDGKVQQLLQKIQDISSGAKRDELYNAAKHNTGFTFEILQDIRSEAIDLATTDSLEFATYSKKVANEVVATVTNIIENADFSTSAGAGLWSEANKLARQHYDFFRSSAVIKALMAADPTRPLTPSALFSDLMQIDNISELDKLSRLGEYFKNLVKNDETYAKVLGKDFDLSSMIELAKQQKLANKAYTGELYDYLKQYPENELKSLIPDDITRNAIKSVANDIDNLNKLSVGGRPFLQSFETRKSPESMVQALIYSDIENISPYLDEVIKRNPEAKKDIRAAIMNGMKQAVEHSGEHDYWMIDVKQFEKMKKAIYATDPKTGINKGLSKYLTQEDKKVLDVIEHYGSLLIDPTASGANLQAAGTLTGATRVKLSAIFTMFKMNKWGVAVSEENSKLYHLLNKTVMSLSKVEKKPLSESTRDAWILSALVYKNFSNQYLNEKEWSSLITDSTNDTPFMSEEQRKKLNKATGYKTFSLHEELQRAGYPVYEKSEGLK